MQIDFWLLLDFLHHGLGLEDWSGTFLSMSTRGWVGVLWALEAENRSNKPPTDHSRGHINERNYSPRGDRFGIVGRQIKLNGEKRLFQANWNWCSGQIQVSLFFYKLLQVTFLLQLKWTVQKKIVISTNSKFSIKQLSRLPKDRSTKPSSIATIPYVPWPRFSFLPFLANEPS